MIPRYARPQMAALWSDEYRYNLWLQIELTICEALAKAGSIPEKALERLKKNATVNPNKIHDRIPGTRCEFQAFLDEAGSKLKAEAKYFHTNVSALDVIETALALQLTRSGVLILHGLHHVLGALESRISVSKDLVMVARTHGTHAEPITLSFKLANWYTELDRHRERLLQAVEGIRVGKLSGPVGTFVVLGPELEEAVCSELGLRPELISTLVIPRDRHAFLSTTLALLATTLEKIATEIRNLHRTEIHEVEEASAGDSTASPTLPHQRSPVICETICGLARVVRTNAMAAMETMLLSHEGDHSNAAIEQIVLPDCCCLVDYMLDQIALVIRELVILPETMMRNMALSKGLIFSTKVVSSLIKSGVENARAYQLVVTEANNALQGTGDFRELLLGNQEIRKQLSEADINSCFEIDAYLVRIPQLLKRIGL